MTRQIGSGRSLATRSPSIAHLPRTLRSRRQATLTPEEINKRIDQGFQFIAVSIDAALLTSAAKGLVEQIKR